MQRSTKCEFGNVVVMCKAIEQMLQIYHHIYIYMYIYISPRSSFMVAVHAHGSKRATPAVQHLQIAFRARALDLLIQRRLGHGCRRHLDVQTVSSCPSVHLGDRGRQPQALVPWANSLSALVPWANSLAASTQAFRGVVLEAAPLE